MNLAETKEALLRAAQEMDRTGLTEGTAGNLSARAESGEIVLTPAAFRYDAMTQDDLVVIDAAGQTAPGQRPATTEASLHLACLRAYPEIGAVVHTHPVHACMFAVNQSPIPCVLEEFEFYVGGDVNVAAYERTGTEALGQGVVPLLRDRAAALLANHGLVVVAKTPSEGLALTRLVDRAARIVQGALAMGKPVPLPQTIRSEFKALYQERRRGQADPQSH